MPKLLPSDAGRGFAYIGAIGGFGLSLWANVRDAYIPEIPKGVDAALWREGFPGYQAIDPTGFDIVIAGFFPVALFIALELMTRVKWKPTKAHNIVRYVGVGLPALVAGFISYSHLKTAMLLGGSSEQLASLGPLAVDGFMLLCSVVLLMTGKHGSKELNTGTLNATPAPPMNTPATPSLTVQPVPMNTPLAATVQSAVPAAQPVNEHPTVEPVNTPLTEPVNTPEPTPVNTTEEPAVNTPKPTAKPAPKKRVNTPKAKPVNTSRAAELNTARQLLADGKSVREVATALNISVGKASGLKKEIEAGGPVEKAPAKKSPDVPTPTAEELERMLAFSADEPTDES